MVSQYFAVMQIGPATRKMMKENTAGNIITSKRL